MEDENAKIERELQAQIERELEAEMAKRRADIAVKLRREAAMKELDRINARHPIENRYSGLTPEAHAARLAEMDRRAAADFAAMDAVNARPVPGSLAAARADQKGGGSGFRIKRPGG
jgi:hypothetical protein